MLTNADAWAVVCALLTDPSAARVLVEQLQRLPAAVRRIGAPDAVGDEGLRDLEDARLWRAMAREVRDE